MIIKEAGVPVKGQHFAALTMHMGSTLYRVMEKGRPLCKCGCGTPVNWDFTRRRWREYVDHHRSLEVVERIRKAVNERSVRISREFFKKIRKHLPCTQSTLHDKMGLSQKACPQAIRRLEKYVFIGREKFCTRAGGDVVTIIFYLLV